MLNVSHAGAPSELWSNSPLSKSGRKKYTISKESLGRSSLSGIELDDTTHSDLLHAHGHQRTAIPILRSTLKRKHLDDTGLFSWDANEYYLTNTKHGIVMKSEKGDFQLNLSLIHQVLSFGGSACRFDIILENGHAFSFLTPDTATCDKWMKALHPQEEPGDPDEATRAYDSDKEVFRVAKSSINMNSVNSTIEHAFESLNLKKSKTAKTKKSTKTATKKSSSKTVTRKRSTSPTRKFKPESTNIGASILGAAPSLRKDTVKKTVRKTTRTTRSRQSGLAASKSSTTSLGKTAEAYLELKRKYLEQEREIAGLKLLLTQHKQDGHETIVLLQRENQQLKAERNALEQLFEKSNNALARLRKEHQILIESRRSSMNQGRTSRSRSQPRSASFGHSSRSMH